MSSSNVLIYGANGYTGELIARLASSYQLKPTLAGRNEFSVKKLANTLLLPYLIVELDDSKKLDEIVSQFSLVINAAGPFSKTAKFMVESCLRNSVHYTDINGDISCFELVKEYNLQAIEKNCMLMPGVGFDVVPTDCVAQLLHENLPDAVDLKIAFATVGSTISHGTANTMTEKMGEAGARRVNGVIVSAKLGEHGMMVDFGDKNLFCMSIPWGDISTAFQTTGIPNIETFTCVNPMLYKQLKYQKIFNWLLRTAAVRRYAKNKIKSRPAGPSQSMRDNGKCFVWGKATNLAGDIKEALLNGPEGYSFTAHSTLIIAKEILNGNWKAGYQTPAGWYGYKLAEKIPGVKISLR
jgi:short subunit dehydrogenase-like uncharacterized protein